MPSARRRHFCILLLPDKSMASGGTRPAGFVFKNIKKEGNRLTICCPKLQSKHLPWKEDNPRITCVGCQKSEAERFLFRPSCPEFSRFLPRFSRYEPINGNSLRALIAATRTVARLSLASSVKGPALSGEPIEPRDLAALITSCSSSSPSRETR